MIQASVIVPARDAAATIGRALEALAAQDLDAEYEVLVVDDGSTDDTVAVAQRTPGPVRILRQPARGPGEARNLGAREARGEALAFTDADCFAESDWLRRGIRALEHADLVQGRARPDPEASLGPFDHTIWIPADTGLYETANLFVRRALWEQIGGFEDWLEVRLGKRLGEDVWFGWKARRDGARPAFAPDAIVNHAVIPRGPRGFLAERRRLVYFPALVRKVPELRREFLFARWFLNRRSAAFDAALAGVPTAGVLAASAPLPAALAACAALPYGWMIALRAARARRAAPIVTAVEIAADAIGLAALIAGSARRRTLVL